MRVLPQAFFLRSDVTEVARDLLGKQLTTCIGGVEITGGIIVETEAYGGAHDRASHAFGNRRTKRTEMMFHGGGVAYVYLCYGIHAMLNVVTGEEGQAAAVLLRAIEPTLGVELMLKRRARAKLDFSVAGGPGALTEALGIACSHNGESLRGPRIRIEDRGLRIEPSAVLASPRVGVAYAGEDAARPWRFRVRNSAWTSRAR